MYNLRNSFTLICCLLSFSLAAQEKEIVLNWGPVEGAETYHILIHDNQGLEIYDINTPEPPLYLTLFPGDYQYRIEVLNKLGDTISSTLWKDLSVKQALKPFATPPRENSWYSHYQPYQSVIRAVGLEQGAALYFVKAENRIPLEWEGESDDSYRISYQGIFEEEGEYSLLIENPSGNSILIEKALFIEAYLKPAVEEWVHRELYYSSELAFLELKGTGFDSLSRFELSNEQYRGAPIRQEEYQSGNIRIGFDIQSFPQGTYDLYISNSNGESLRIEQALSVIDDLRENQVIEEMQASPQRDITFSAGIPLAFPLANEKNLVNPSLLGLSIRMEGLLNNALLQGLFYRDHFYGGLQISEQIYSYNIKSDIILHSINLELDLSYRFLKDSRLRPAILLGGGLSCSTYSNSATADIFSLDYLLKAGGSLQLNMGKRFFFQQQLLYYNMFYVEKNFMFFRAETYVGVHLK